MPKYKELEWQVDPEKGCHLVTSHRPQRSGYIQIYRNGKRVRAHREVYEQACGPIPEGKLICHICDNRACINPEHLFVGTNLDNMRDKVEKDRQPRGEDNGRAKIVEQDVLYIREHPELSLRQIAKIFGIGKSQARRIRSGQQWKHVE